MLVQNEVHNMLAFREGEWNAVSRCLPVIIDSSPGREEKSGFCREVLLLFLGGVLQCFSYIFYGLPTEISKSKLDLMLYQTGIKSFPFTSLFSFLFDLSSFSLGCFGYDCFS